MIDAINEERKAEDVREEDELLVRAVSPRYDHRLLQTYLSDVCTYLANLRKELYPGHPFIMAKSSLSCKVMDVLHKSFQYELESWVRTLRVNELHVVGDVINGKIFQRRYCDFGGIHRDSRRAEITAITSSSDRNGLA